MSEPHFYEQIESVAKAFADAKKDNKVTWEEAAGVVYKMLQAGIHAWRALDSDDGHFDRLVTDTELVFDRYIVPLDFPLNDFLERIAERFMRLQIRPSLQRLRELLD